MNACVHRRVGPWVRQGCREGTGGSVFPPPPARQTFATPLPCTPWQVLGEYVESYQAGRQGSGMQGDDWRAAGKTLTLAGC